MRRLALIGLFAAGTLAAAPCALADGDVEKGRDIAQKHCARCHVIGEFNKYGGIDSTPSFPLLLRLSDYLERFQTFYQRRPHPSFVRMENVPPPSTLPANATPFEINAEGVEDVIAFAETLKKK